MKVEYSYNNENMTKHGRRKYEIPRHHCGPYSE